MKSRPRSRCKYCGSRWGHHTSCVCLTDTWRRLYRIAHGAIQRCTNNRVTNWRSYGGRGIKVWDSWIINSRSFVEYLLTLEGHDNPGLTLDRKDNDGDYVPGNLRFVTRAIQDSNHGLDCRHCGRKRGHTVGCTRPQYLQPPPRPESPSSVAFIKTVISQLV